MDIEQMHQNIPPTPHKSKMGLAIASMVLGILSIITFFAVILPIIFGILAIIFGILALKGTGRGMAIAGIVTGTIGSVLLIVIIVFGLVVANFYTDSFEFDGFAVVDEIDVLDFDEIHMVAHTFGRLSFELPSYYREDTPGAFIGRSIIVSANLFEDNVGFDRSDFGHSLISFYEVSLMAELTTPQDHLEIRDTAFATSPFTNHTINNAVWGRIDMTINQGDAQHSLVSYFMTSGEEAYFIEFLMDYQPSDEDLATVEDIINSVIFDDSHHRADIQGVWRGSNPESGYIIIEGDTFHWHLAYRDMDNVFIGEYNVRVGFRGAGNILLLEPGRFDANAFAVSVIYTDIVIGGESLAYDEWPHYGQTYIFFPHEDDQNRFTVEVQPGHLQMEFERVESY